LRIARGTIIKVTIKNKNNVLDTWYVPGTVPSHVQISISNLTVMKVITIQSTKYRSQDLNPVCLVANPELFIFILYSRHWVQRPMPTSIEWGVKDKIGFKEILLYPSVQTHVSHICKSP
jgi:hypothetical protein